MGRDGRNPVSQLGNAESAPGQKYQGVKALKHDIHDQRHCGATRKELRARSTSYHGLSARLPSLAIKLLHRINGRGLSDWITNSRCGGRTGNIEGVKHPPFKVLEPI